MPWTGEMFLKRHNKKLSSSKAKKAASIANAILRKGGSDASAIRIANWQVKKRKRGGR